MVLASVLDAIGGTPLISLSRLAPPESTIYLKCEHYNPGGSHKARIALNMVLQAEQDGWLTRGSGQTILEPTGGNTGIGVAMAGTVLGYRVLLVIPDNYSKSKQQLLRALGAEIVLSDSSRGNNSHGELAMELQFEHPEYVMLNQGANPANPAAHVAATAVEILRDLDGEIPTVMVAGIGTGGHLSGVGYTLRQQFPNMRIVGVEPTGCSILEGVYRKHGIQGLSIGYLPKTLQADLIDEMVQVSETEAVDGTRALMGVEGICAGLSSGANIAACLRLARAEPGARILTFSYDNVNDYLDEVLPE